MYVEIYVMGMYLEIGFIENLFNKNGTVEVELSHKNLGINFQTERKPFY